MKREEKHIDTLGLIFYLSPIIVVSLIPIIGWITSPTTLIFALIVWSFIYLCWLNERSK